MHKFVYGYGLVVGVVVRVRVVTKRLLGSGHQGWGHLVVAGRKDLIGIVYTRVFMFLIALVWME